VFRGSREWEVHRLAITSESAYFRPLLWLFCLLKSVLVEAARLFNMDSRVLALELFDETDGLQKDNNELEELP